MTKSKSKITAIVLKALLLIVMLLATGSSAIAAPPLEGPYLFTDSAIEGVSDTSDDPTIVRTRFVNINFDMLGRADGLQEDESEISNLLVLNLFEDVVFTAVLDGVEPNRSGGYSWIGHVEGVEHSQVILAVKDRLMAGNIALPGAFYQVRYAGSGVHAIYKIDQSAFPPEAEPIPVDTSDEGEAPDAAMADDGSTIDVLVVYTPAARSAAGGTTAMETLINLAVAETNQSYANSGIAQRLNLVHMAEVSYTESGNISTDLNRLTGTSDGYIDNVHTLRNTYCADEVVLTINNVYGSTCGVAWLMTSVSHSFEANAFAVVVRTCATGYYSFGHELGHTMGARHDWYRDDDTTPYGYAHGYVNTTDRWRTIMAYNTECADSGFNCTRLSYWSNPDVTYGGDPMGVPEGTSTACTEGVHPNCDADNRKTLNNTAYTIANFRESCGSGNVGPVAYDSHTVDDDNSDQSSGNDDGIVDPGETIELYVTLYNQGSDTATGVNATISTSDPYITFTDNTNSSYPDIPGGGTATNSNDFDLEVDPSTPDGHVIDFDLDITASDGGPWSDSFNVPVGAQSDEENIYLPIVLKGYPPTCSDTQLIQNGGFESGNTLWVQQSGSYTIISQQYPRTGSWGTWFGGYDSADDRLYQSISIPANISSARLTLYLHIYTTDSLSTPYDYWHAELQNSSGGTLESFLWADNTMADSGWYKGTVSWSSFASHAGTTRRLFFQATTNSSKHTNFFVDDVTLWTYCGSPPAATGESKGSYDGWTWEKVDSPPKSGPFQAAVEKRR